MFKLLVLQQMYNIADDELEYQINDRLSFMRFLHLGLEDAVPDAKTVWAFKEQLRQQELVAPLFNEFAATSTVLAIRQTRSNLGLRRWCQLPELFLESPNGLGIWHRIFKAQMEKTHERQSVINLILQFIIGDVVHLLQHQQLEHHDNVDGFASSSSLNLHPTALFSFEGHLD
jgi:hypothetical protein